MFTITGAAACGFFTITGAAAGGLFTIVGATAGGLITITGAVTGSLISEFKSTGRNFGKGGATFGTAADLGIVVGKTGGGTTAGAARFGFGGGERTDLAFDVLHFANFAFEQSCRSMRFILFSISCSSDEACAAC